MAKQAPKSVVNLIERMNAHISKAQELNEQLEEWLEKNGVTNYGFDYTYDFRDSAAYSIYDIDGFIKKINSDLGSK